MSLNNPSPNQRNSPGGLRGTAFESLVVTVDRRNKMNATMVSVGTACLSLGMVLKIGSMESRY